MTEEECKEIIKKYQSDINNIIKTVRVNYKKADIRKIQKAYEYAVVSHADQKRETGEPYIIHPIYVAQILADMTLDEETIIAGILHDVLEDTEVKYEDLEKEFGESIADMVDRCYKT